MPPAGPLTPPTPKRRCHYVMAIALLLLAAELLAQPLTGAQGAVLKGTILLNRVDGSGMANVAISAEGANNVVSDSNGRFQLVFSGKRPGDKFRLRVNRSGWRPVNGVQLEGNLPQPGAEGLEIILAKEDEFERYAEEFYRLKGQAVVRESYEQQLAGLKGDTAAKDAAIARLNQELERAMEQVKQLAQGFARDTTGNSTRHQEATREFLAGNLDGALAILNEKTVEAELAKLKAEQKQQREKLVKEFLLRGELLTLKLDFAAAKQAYKRATEHFPDSENAWFQYAYFLQQQNDYQEARPAYQTALYLYRQLAKENPKVYLPDVASTLNNLGVLLSDENQMAEARKAYEEALEVRRQLAKENPKVYLPNVATTLNNLGNLLTNENQLAEARKAYEEALGVYRQLAKENPKVYLPDVAMTLNNLGNLLSDENQMAEARKAYEEALGVYRQLAKENPKVYLPDVAMTLNNLGNLLSDENQMAEVRKAYEEALGIYLAFYAHSPRQYEANLNLVKRNLAKLNPAE